MPRLGPQRRAGEDPRGASGEVRAVGSLLQRRGLVTAAPPAGANRSSDFFAPRDLAALPAEDLDGTRGRNHNRGHLLAMPPFESKTSVSVRDDAHGRRFRAFLKGACNADRSHHRGTCRRYEVILLKLARSVPASIDDPLNDALPCDLDIPLRRRGRSQRVRRRGAGRHDGRYACKRHRR